MKKIGSLLLAVLMLVGMMAVCVNAAPAVDGRKTCTAYVADVKIDGTIDDAWVYAPVINVDTVKENASAWFGDASKVAGVDFATLESRVLWNGKDELYVLMIVDDKLISSVGGDPWNRDSFELFVQYDNEAEDDTAAKYQARFFTEAENGQEYVSDAILDCEYGMLGSKYVLEICVDLSQADLGAGPYIGIDFQYNDDAMGDGVRAACLGWSDSVDAASRDCTVYGQCLLSDTTIETVKAEAEAAAAAAAAEAEAAADGAEADASAPVVAPATADAGIVVAAVVMACAAAFVCKTRR